MIGPRASSFGALNQVFSGWSDVESWFDERRSCWTVKLSINDEDLAYAAHHGAPALVDRIMPKTGIKPPQITGVRFHGRIVGRRA